MIFKISVVMPLAGYQHKEFYKYIKLQTKNRII